MADLLAHVLAGYVLGTLLVGARESIPSRFVPVAMVGAALPDLAKVRLLVPSELISSTLGVPFSWLALHRLGGAVAVAGVGALLFRRGERPRAFGLLALGVASHFLLDLPVKRADGFAPPYLYPLSMARPPAGGLYLSSDLWPTLVAAVAAGAVWVGARRRGRS